MMINVHALANDRPFKHTPAAIDAVLTELLAAVHFLCTSPDVIKLESEIQEELKQFS
jgi:hypothetical protein